MKIILQIVLLALAMPLVAQNSIPPGTILPLALQSSLNSRKVRSGQIVTARIMQDLPLPAEKIHAGAKVIGHVTRVKPASASDGAQISVRFDTLVVSGRSTPITTNLRAVASMMAVEEAQLPESGPDRGTSENAWTTNQVGGQVVYRGGGPLADGLRPVGEPTTHGVLAPVASRSGTPCRGEIEGDDRAQAFWIFSSDACGTYDFSNLEIVHAGRCDPLGEITLASLKGDLLVRAGSGLLLRVNSPHP